MDARQGAGRGRAALVGLERKKERGNGGGSASGGRDDDDDDGRRDTDTPPSRPLAPFALSPSLARSLPPSLRQRQRQPVSSAASLDVARVLCVWTVDAKLASERVVVVVV